MPDSLSHCRPCFLLWAVALCWGICLSAVHCTTAQEDELPPPPDDIQMLLDSGQVEIKFYDPQTNPRQFLGETRYDYSFRHNFNVNYEQTPKTGSPKGVKVSVSDITYETDIKHVIHLPESHRGPKVWEKTLTRHEFDHVAISLHPRVKLLLEEVYAEREKLEFDLPSGQKLEGKWVTQQVDKYLTERANAVFQMIPENNQKLDKLTKHGVKSIEDRAAYFDSLYQKANLDENGFPYTGEMLPLLKSEAYQKTEPLFLP